jgi:LacI family gluconate utilization system Gnt-I transcriptional repressor
VVLRSGRCRRASSFAEHWMADGGEQPSILEVNIPSHFGQGRLAFRGLTDLEHRPDVVVCGSDWIAQGLLVRPRLPGCAPDQLAVTGLAICGWRAICGPPSPRSISMARGSPRRCIAYCAPARRVSAAFTLVDVGFRIIARESAEPETQ